MKQRLKYLIGLFFVLLTFFVVQKPLFMIYNSNQLSGAGAADFFSVILNGLPLDLAVSGYVCVIPLLVLIFTSGLKTFRLRFWLSFYNALISLLLSAIFVVDTGLFQFWKFKLNATIYTFLASPAEVFASVSWWFAFMGISIILLLAFFLYLTVRKITPTIIKTPKSLYSWLCLSVLLCGFDFLAIRGGIGDSTNNVGTAYFSENTFLNQSAVNPVFSLFYTTSKYKDYSKQCSFFADDKCAELFGNIYNESRCDSVLTWHFLKSNRPDVLLIVLESFSAKFVESLGGMKGVTPNLDSLIRNGISFNNCYCNSFRTDRGLVAILSGYLGMPNATIMKMAEKCATLPSVAKSLRNLGYSTTFLYGGDINFTNMSGYLLSTGFEHLISDKDFPLIERHSASWGVSDEYSFNRLYNVMKESKSPSFTTMLTLSSHDPFDVPFDKFEDKVRNSIAYTDYCLGKFISKIRTTPLWDNLLIVCVADHGYTYQYETNRSQPVSFHIPLVMTGGAVKGKAQVEKVVNQSDLAATLLNQMGGVNTCEFEFSRNIFSAGYLPFAYYSFIDGFGIVDSKGYTVFDNNSNTVISNTGNGEETRENKGKAILQSMYKDISKR